MLTVVSLMFPYLFGLGCLLLLVCGSIRREVPAYDVSARLQLSGCVLLFGIALNHLIVLSLASLQSSLLLGSVLSAAGLGYFCSLRSRRRHSLSLGNWLAVLAVVYLVCLFFVLVNPVEGWDARFIWFLHGKMIFYNSFVDAGGDWLLPSIAYSHPDYPKLVPILAAQVAYVAGFWNAYLPKMSLVGLLLPALLCLISIPKAKWWHVLFISCPLLIANDWLRNGYIDGYLALYAGLAAFFCGRWLDKRNQLDLISGVLFLGLILAMKNEGLLLCAVFVAFVSLFFFRPKNRLKAPQSNWLEVAALLLVSLASYAVWSKKVHSLGLHNDLQLGLKSVDKLLTGLTDGSLLLLLTRIYVAHYIGVSIGVLLISLILALRAGRRPSQGSQFCIFAGVAYLSGLILVYLASPYSLSFLFFSLERTMLPVHMIFLVAICSLYGGDCEKAACPSYDLGQ